jgi:UDP-N-acetylmuramyl pentapeptide phosphotransferase/UDP-N-acetylglucosamine-1-phosphate transferase
MLIPFTITAVLTALIISLPKKWTTNESDTFGVQKFHKNPVPHIGGALLFTGFFIGLWFLPAAQEIRLLLLVASLPVFIAGIAEDCTRKIGPNLRMIAALLSITIAFFYLDIGIRSLNFAWPDYLLSNFNFLSLLFTLLVVGGLINAINIIDGYNGLMAGYSVLALLAIAYVSHILGDGLVFQLSLTLTASLAGFFVFNFPLGKIFMGDGGAYFVGLIMAVIGLMLGIRNDEVSHWFILLLFIYPLYETAFSIYRRKLLHKTYVSQPDANHLHSLVYRKLISCDRFKHNKVICNSMTAPVMWLLSLLGVIPAVIWFNNQTMLIVWAFVFMLIYTIIYRRIMHFKFKR